MPNAIVRLFDPHPGHRRGKLPRNVMALGWVAFLTDMASEMLYPVLPLFVTGTLGASPAVLGLIDGIAEGGSTVLRWVSGAVSDRFRKRKPFVVAGYSISALAKPLMGLAAYAVGWPLFLIGRSMDRLGKAVRTSARDALIVDSADESQRGFAFGLHRAMDTAGATLGPLLTLLILLVKPDFPLAWLFFVALGPGVLSSLLALVAVRDIPHPPRPGVKPPPILQSYPRPLWHLIAAAGIFSLGNSSDSFLILRSKELGLSFWQVILAYAVFNVVYSFLALPLGHLSDRIGRKPVIVAGWLSYAGVYVGFALAKTPAAPWGLFAAYGLYQALSEGVTKAMVGDLVPKEQRAGAIGLFYTVGGLGQLIASLIAGAVWHVRITDHQMMLAFLIGAACSLGAIIVITTLPETRRNGGS